MIVGGRGKAAREIRVGKGKGRSTAPAGRVGRREQYFRLPVRRQPTARLCPSPTVGSQTHDSDQPTLMVDSDLLSSPTADTASRPSARSKQPRSQQPSSNVRQRSPSNNDGSSHPDHKVPTKRARKAINCEPCRNSKLKCDRCVQTYLLDPRVLLHLKRPIAFCLL